MDTEQYAKGHLWLTWGIVVVVAALLFALSFTLSRADGATLPTSHPTATPAATPAVLCPARTGPCRPVPTGTPAAVVSHRSDRDPIPWLCRYMMHKTRSGICRWNDHDHDHDFVTWGDW